MECLTTAGPEHMKLIWEWRNDELTRQMSLQPDWIPFDKHEEWFRKVLADRQRALYIMKINGDAVAVIRFDIRASDADISIHVAPEKRGKGIASRAIGLAIDVIRDRAPQLNSLVAIIKAINTASLIVFEKNGFTKVHEEQGVITLRRKL